MHVLFIPIQLARASIAVILLVGLIPLLFGFLLEVVVLMPVRVSLNQSPVFFLWQDWALGAMYTKITIALTFMGPDWWLKRAIEQLYIDGLRRLNLAFLIPKLVVPAVTALGLSLSLPYIAAHSLVPLVLTEPHLLVMIQRRIYPFLLLLVVTVGLIVVQLKQFKKLYEHIKNDRYVLYFSYWLMSGDLITIALYVTLYSKLHVFQILGWKKTCEL